MNPIIGFAGNGHLMKYSAAAAHIKGFKKVTFTPGKTGDSVEDLQGCNIVYICPDRPSSISPQKMVDIVLPHLQSNTILVILCQVDPGFTRTVNWPSSLLYYQVETLRVTDESMDRAVNPERIIIGHSNHITYAHHPLSKFLDSFNCPIISMSYEAAEFTKIALNIYLSAQLGVTNTLSEVAAKIEVNWEDIIPALQTDRRIGEHAYLHPGNGCGPHLERDLAAVANMDGNMSVMRSLLDHSQYRRKHSKT